MFAPFGNQGPRFFHQILAHGFKNRLCTSMWVCEFAKGCILHVLIFACKKQHHWLSVLQTVLGLCTKFEPGCNRIFIS